MTLAPSPNAAGVLASSLSVCSELVSFSTTEVVVLKIGEVGLLSVLDNKALPDTAAAAAKGEAVACANEPKVGTEDTVLLEVFKLLLIILEFEFFSTVVLSFNEG